MQTQRWDPNWYYCVVNEHGHKHAKGCRDPRQGTLRRDPKNARYFYSVECSKLLSPEVQARLIRCIPTPGKGCER